MCQGRSFTNVCVVAYVGVVCMCVCVRKRERDGESERDQRVVLDIDCGRPIAL